MNSGHANEFIRAEGGITPGANLLGTMVGVLGVLSTEKYPAGHMTEEATKFRPG